MRRSAIEESIHLIEERIRNLSLYVGEELNSIALSISEIEDREREERVNREAASRQSVESEERTNRGTTRRQSAPPQEEPNRRVVPFQRHAPPQQQTPGSVRVSPNANPRANPPAASARHAQLNDRVRIKLYNGAYADGVIIGRTPKRLQIRLDGRRGIMLRAPHNVEVLLT
jgi:TolA-binding protein